MGGIVDISEVERSTAQQRADEIYKPQERIRQLEQLNATLAAEIDRMRPVIEAMQRLQIFDNGVSRDQIAEALTDYEASRPR